MRRMMILMRLGGLALTSQARTFQEIQKEILQQQYQMTRCQLYIAETENWIAGAKLSNLDSSEQIRKERLADIARLEKSIALEKICAADINKRIDELRKELAALPPLPSTQLPEQRKSQKECDDVGAKVAALMKRHLKAESDLRELRLRNAQSTSNDRKGKL